MKHIGQKGFSLVEVLITLGILIILAAIAIPQMGGIIENYRLNGAARVVWSDMQNAKMTAIRENRSIRVEFDTTSRTSYRFVPVAGGSPIFTRNLANDYPGVTVSSGSITFNSRGMANTATITISLAGRVPERKKSFTIAWTGRIGEIRTP